MKRTILIMTMAVVLVAGMWTLNPVQSAAASFSATTSVTASSHVSGAVIGKPVRNERGVVLGTVKNIVLSERSCVDYVILSGKFHGARSRLYPIPWTVIARSGPDAIFVDFDPEFLVSAPSFRDNRWPDFSQTQYQTKIREFYQRKAGVTGPGAPGETRGKIGEQEKTKTERGADIKKKPWERPAAEGVLPEQKSKEKERLQKERKQTPAERGTQGLTEPSKKAPVDTKMKQLTEPRSGQKLRDKPGMMEQGGSKMMERGKGRMMERGGSQMMEKGRSQGEKLQQKDTTSHGGSVVTPGKTDEKRNKPGEQ